MRRVLLGLVLVALLVAGCGPSTPLRSAQDAATPPDPAVADAQDAGASEAAGTGLGATRLLVAPDAPVLLTGPWSRTTNVRWVGGDPVDGGPPVLLYTDVVVRWRHADPVSVDRYEVWQSPLPYFAVPSCTSCTQVASSTGLRVTVADSPPHFNPVGGTAAASIMSEFHFYRVRAVNGAGASGDSNEIGVVNYSLLQGATELPTFVP